MSRYRKWVVLGLCLGLAGPAMAGQYDLGRPALPEEIAAWDLDVHPDGTGLPAGQGSVKDGERLFSERCAACHGEFAEGVGNWPELAGGEGTLADKDPVKTVGSYWPYLSTVWDYVHRSMPFGDAQSLSDDEVYAITAYILYSNYLVEEDFVLSDENFLEVAMPNADGFIVDDREEAEAHFWTDEPCMEDCKDSVEITMRAHVLDVTPEDEGGEVVAEDAVEVAATDTASDPELVAEGEKVFRKCKACHQVGEGAKNRVGPHLNGVVGRAAGAVEGFRYSKPLETAAAEGLVWSQEALGAFLADPRGFLKGTKMAFAGLKSEVDRAAIAAYLATFE
ncbi:c-type cytochrome [Roseovarius sp.]|uniref:c-type cytochrome n=1 Tax=Roseovarius sp. TaxID=1486281 RepID=UPI003BADB777